MKLYATCLSVAWLISLKKWSKQSRLDKGCRYREPHALNRGHQPLVLFALFLYEKTWIQHCWLFCYLTMLETNWAQPCRRQVCCFMGPSAEPIKVRRMRGREDSVLCPLTGSSIYGCSLPSLCAHGSSWKQNKCVHRNFPFPFSQLRGIQP